MKKSKLEHEQLNSTNIIKDLELSIDNEGIMQF